MDIPSIPVPVPDTGLNITQNHMDNIIKKELVYTLPYTTEMDIKIAGDVRERLYSEYDSVQVYPNGAHEVRIVATNETNV
jgi:hypothetical protein